MNEAKTTSKLWPIHLKPRDDELLSSWLARLASAHGMKLHTFCSLTWPEKQIWNRDIDKTTDAELSRTLSEKTGTPLDKARDTMLSMYENILYERHNHFGPNPWIMPIGIYHRIRKQFGLQYCPRCLAEDDKPYYRRKWRLAFMVLCEKHHVLLHDRCSECQEPINFHRGELGKHRTFVAASLTFCHACKFNLQTTRSECITLVTSAEAAFTVKLLKAMKDGFIQITDGIATYSHLFFMGLRQLIKILAMQDERIIKMHLAISDLCGTAPYTPTSSKSIDFQEQGLKPRRQLLEAVSYLLEEWPDRFVNLSREFKVWSSLWLRHLAPAGRTNTSPTPFWLWHPIHDHLYRAKYSPSSEEINSAMRQLEVERKTVSNSALARQLGVKVIRRDFNNGEGAALPLLIKPTEVAEK